MKDYRIGIDVGGTKVNLALTSKEGKLLSKSRMDVPAGISCRTLMYAVADKARELLKAHGISADETVAPGMGIPGTVDGLTVLNAPNLHWQNEPCGMYFRDAFGVEPVLMQDTRAAAWGEYTLGAAKGRKCVVCVTLGTGVGCGVVINGSIWLGALGTAGEVGHIPVIPNGRACNCGRFGCMEAYASGTGLARTLAEHPEWGIADPRELFRQAEINNPVALKVIDDAVTLAAQAISAVINVLSPDAVIFSGGLSAQEKLYVQPLMEKIRAMAYPLAVDSRLLMATSILGEDSPALGAAMLCNM